MENLTTLREIRDEVNNMEFSYKNVHRIMYLVYLANSLFKSASPIPNKEIAQHQTSKVIESEVLNLIRSSNDDEVSKAFDELIDNFKLVLAYIT